MKYLLIVVLSLCVFHSQAVVSASDADINITVKKVSNELTIEVTQPVSGPVTLSVFSQMGEIVLATELRPGTNSINVGKLPAGAYTAVVRENDDFKQKLEFQLN
jgi:hypothetical protein